MAETSAAGVRGPATRVRSWTPGRLPRPLRECDRGPRNRGSRRDARPARTALRRGRRTAASEPGPREGGAPRGRRQARGARDRCGSERRRDHGRSGGGGGAGAGPQAVAPGQREPTAMPATTASASTGRGSRHGRMPSVTTEATKCLKAEEGGSVGEDGTPARGTGTETPQSGALFCRILQDLDIVVRRGVTHVRWNLPRVEEKRRKGRSYSRARLQVHCRAGYKSVAVARMREWNFRSSILDLLSCLLLIRQLRGRGATRAPTAPRGNNHPPATSTVHTPTSRGRLFKRECSRHSRHLALATGQSRPRLSVAASAGTTQTQAHLICYIAGRERHFSSWREVPAALQCCCVYELHSSFHDSLATAAFVYDYLKVKERHSI